MTRTNHGLPGLVAVMLIAMPSIAHGQANPALPPPLATALLRGRIVAADTGRGLRRAQVSLTAPELTERLTANTNADGRYEFKELPAGRYTVSVSRSGYLPLRYGQRRPLEPAAPLQVLEHQTVEHIDFALPRMATISGRITDETLDPMAGVLVQAMRSTYFEGRRQLMPVLGSGVVRTDDAGQYRVPGLAPGSYFVMATTQEKWTVNAEGQHTVMGYAPTYLPGTTDVADARRIAVGIGQHESGDDFSLIPARTAKVSGTAIDSHGRPLVGQSVALTFEFRSPEGGGGGFSVSSATVAADGAFAIQNVPPGEYRLRTATRTEGSGIAGAPTQETATLPVVVTGVNLENVTLITSRGWSMTGQIMTDSGGVPTVPRARISIRGQQFSGGNNPQQGWGQVQDDWTFSVKNIFGPARLRVNLPDGLTMKAVVHDGRDISETPIEMKSGEELSGVQVIVSDRVTTVTGQLADGRGAPIADGTVLVFAEEGAKWSEDSRFVRAGRPDQQGQYQIKGLPPGQYLAVAIDYVQEGMWNDPEYLESIRRYAQRLTLGEGDSQTVSLKLITP